MLKRPHPRRIVAAVRGEHGESGPRTSRRLAAVATTPAVLLVLANLPPILGVLYFDWDVFPIILLFWLENVVVGLFNVLRMLWVKPSQPTQWLAKIFMVPFFIFHYGMFTLVHGVFVLALFGERYLEGNTLLQGSAVRHAAADYGLGIFVFALVVSHGYSFVWNYVRGGEFRSVTLGTLMHRPYGRVIIMHVVIIIGGLLVMTFDSPPLALVLLIVLKTGLDLLAHLSEHRKLAGSDKARM